jgi:hypothetical protein
MACPTDDAVIQIKTGSIAEFVMQYTDDQDPPEPLSLDGMEIFMDFVNPKTRRLLSSCSIGDGITIMEGNYDGPGDPIEDPYKGMYTVDAGSTEDWPLVKIPVDIKYVKNGKAQHTETFYLEIIHSYTK